MDYHQLPALTQHCTTKWGQRKTGFITLPKVCKKILCVREKCTLRTYVLATLKAEDMKEINRKQAQERTKVDSFFYIICIGCQGSEKILMWKLQTKEKTQLDNPTDAEDKVVQYFWKQRLHVGGWNPVREIPFPLQVSRRVEGPFHFTRLILPALPHTQQTLTVCPPCGF